MTKHTSNYLENKMRELSININYTSEFDELYNNVEDRKLQALFSCLHANLVYLFRRMNERLPTGEGTAYYWAEESRQLILAIETIIEMQSKLKSTTLSFKTDSEYLDIMRKCRDFLRQSNGSIIPQHMEKIDIYYSIQIFSLASTMIIENPTKMATELKFIGEGSYAHVFKYKDDFYNCRFALKRAKKDLNDKELTRFKGEFEQMSELSSPYIVEVYSYMENTNEYIMEYMDGTLEEYLSKHNSSITLAKRQGIILQLIKGYQYLHSTGAFHRDVSIKNVLYKEYGDTTMVFKISDFGLVKMVDSDLTSVNTEFKGSLNDPTLKIRGFKEYDILDEIYALTLLFCFVLTGKTNYATIKNSYVKEFLEQGTNADRVKRYLNLDELKDGVIKCISNMDGD